MANKPSERGSLLRIAIILAIFGLLVAATLSLTPSQRPIEETSRARVMLKLLSAIADEFEAVTGAPSRAKDLSAFYQQTQSIHGLQPVWARLVQSDGRPAVDPWDTPIRLIPTSAGPIFESAGPDQQWGYVDAPKQTPAFKALLDNLRSDEKTRPGHP